MPPISDLPVIKSSKTVSRESNQNKEICRGEKGCWQREYTEHQRDKGIL